MSWIEFWNGKTTIYANDRHRRAHYQLIAYDIIAHLPRHGARVLDYGCGEALHADAVAGCCEHLYLCDAAETVRAALQERFGGYGALSVLAPGDIATIPDGSLDLVVANSVVQYMTADQFGQALALWRAKLAPGGRLLLGDIIPPHIGPLTDALALLRFARSNRFLAAAGASLVRTFFSDYRRTRSRLGLLRFDEPAILARLAAAGFAGRRHDANVGHNPARLTIIAEPVRTIARADQHAA